jgi:hypothetical protein
MKNEQMRQGDVLVTRIDRLPAKATPKAREGGRVVLAYGEVTGHAHAIMEPEALLYDFGDEMFLEADGTVTLRHEEHAPVVMGQSLRGNHRVSLLVVSTQRLCDGLCSSNRHSSRVGRHLQT